MNAAPLCIYRQVQTNALYFKSTVPFSNKPGDQDNKKDLFPTGTVFYNSNMLVGTRQPKAVNVMMKDVTFLF